MVDLVSSYLSRLGWTGTTIHRDYICLISPNDNKAKPQNAVGIVVDGNTNLNLFSKVFFLAFTNFGKCFKATFSDYYLN